MKTGTLVNRVALTLIGLSLSVFFIRAAGQTLTVTDIPNQTINLGQSFSEISLDDYVDVPANERHTIKWSASGAEQLNVNINDGRKALVVPLSDTWTGSETITFHATDTNMNNGSDPATFTVQKAANANPVVTDIPNQTFIEGTAFTPVNLDNYVSDADNSNAELTWSASGNTNLSVDINAGSHTATIGVPNPDWNGSEKITFKATDPASGSSQDDATFALTPVNDTPVVSDIPGQSINSGESFHTIALDDFVTDVDNSKAELSWTVTGNSSLSPIVDGSHVATINQPAQWSGSEKLTFTVKDPSNASASDDAVFEAKAVNANPVVTDIPNQTFAEGSPFTPLNLDNYVSDADNSNAELTWSASGNTNLSVDINAGNHTATIEVPNIDWNGSETITFKATDPASGFSQDEATFTLTPVNDPPVVSDIPGQSINSGESFHTIALDDFVTDVDNSKAELSWTVTGNSSLSPIVDGSHVATINQPAQWSGSEKLTFTVKDPSNARASDDAVFEAKAVNAIPFAADDNYSTTQGGTINTATPGVLSNDTDGDLDPLTAIQVTGPSHGNLTLNLDGSFTYINDNSAFASDAFTYQANDGTNLSNTATVTINITLNAPPVLGGIEGGTLAYTEGDGAVSVTSAITVSDDNTNLASAVITISSNYLNGEDVLSFTDANGISGSWNLSGGQLTLTGSATVANYQAALRAVKYTNSSVNPNNFTRTVSFRVSDGTYNSNEVSRTISVTPINSAPVLGSIEGSPLSYNKGDGAVNITSSITATDADNTNLASAVITLTTNYVNGEDVLSYINANGINGSWNAAGGQLTLTGVSSVANYQATLQSVKYTNNSASPSILARTVTFRVSDGSANSNTLSRTISVAGNVAPVIGSVEGTPLAYTEGDGALAVTSALTITDSDDPNMVSAVISISSNYQNGQDVLSFANTGNITGSWNSSNGQLSLSGNTTVANYQAALRSVKYTNNSQNPNPATRAITFSVNDGTVDSNPQIRNISITGVNDAPVLAGIEPATLNYTEGDGPVSVSGAITVTDIDNPTLQSALISITQNYKNTQDALSFTDGNGITGSWNASLGQLTLSGGASLATYQTALRSVKYTNSSSNPNTAIRTITFVANDGIVNSNSVSRTITITQVGVFSANISGSASFCTNSIMPIVLTITDGTAPFTATLHRTGSVSDRDTVITGILGSPRTINVKLTGSYVLSRLVDAQNEDATVSATPVALATYTKPKGVLSGPSTICNDGQPALLTIDLTGASPWSFTIRRGTNDTTYTGITADPYQFPTQITSSPMSVRLIAISDAHCTGDTLGSGTVHITYLTSPTAAIQGQDTICPGGTANLKVTITGTTGPWSITYLKDGANPTVVENIVTSPYTLSVSGTGTYTLTKVQQLPAGCTGRVSGTGKIVSYTVPTATISGSAAFCEHTSTNLNVNLTGNSPWKFSYKLNLGSPIEVVNVTSPTKTVSVNKGGIYTLFEVFDKNCKGTVSGSSNITMTPAPDVTLSGLAPAYNKDSSKLIPIIGHPLGGTFSGPGVIHTDNEWFFLTSLPPAGTHHIVYSYQDGTTHCFGYDTAIVRVLKANAIIEFPDNRTKYCRNEAPFTVTGVNLANNIGGFTISGGAGLVDHHNNTATVNPSQLSVKDYTLTYTYTDGTTLTVVNNFEIGNAPNTDFLWESDCFEPGQPIELKDNTVPTFGNITAYHWKIYTFTGYDTASTKNINYTFPKADNYNVELKVETSYGCTGTLTKVFGLRPTISLKGQSINESFEESPISWQSSTLTPNVNSWTLDTPGGNSHINRAAHGTKCWFTKFPATNPPREKSSVTSPCYDFTGVNRPMVKMQIWRDFSDRRDGSNLQATIDSAKSWFNVGQMDDGLNWYNEYLILGNPGNLSTGWSNKKDGGWIEARHSLDMLKGQKKVQFRIAYGSDGTVQNTEGFAFDDFWIGERNRLVLIEHFTNASDAKSLAADAKLNALVAADSLNTFDLQYHTDFPGDDPFYDQEPFAPSARLLYYGVMNVPYGILNGGYKAGYRFDYAPANNKDTMLIHLESLSDADFDLKFLSSGFQDDQVNFELQIDANSVLPAHEYTVYAGILERKVAGTGNFSGTIFHNVVRAFLPDPSDPSGITIQGPWPVGGQKNYSYKWDIPAGVNRDQLMAFAFMQDEETHEVYQVNKVKIGYSSTTGVNLPGSSKDRFIVFPNPTRDQAFIRFEMPVQGDVRIEIFNNLGSLVHAETVSKTDNDIELLTDKYPNGLYIIRVSSGSKLLGVAKMNITR